MNSSPRRFTPLPPKYKRLQTPHSSLAQVQYGPALQARRRIRINVRGLQFETFQDTLEQYPDTMLGCPSERNKFYDPVEKTYYLDRDPAIFDSILFYYQSNGILAKPEFVPEDLFKEELEFFQIKTELDDASKRNSNSKVSSSPSDVQTFMEISPDDNCHQRATKLRNNCWLIMEYPRLSLAGKILGRVSISAILLSVIVLCLETIPALNCFRNITNNTSGKSNKSDISDEKTFNRSCHLIGSATCTTLAGTSVYHFGVWFVLETALVVFFLMEYVIRILTAPSRCRFVFSFFGLIDAFAIIPYFIAAALCGWRSEMYPQVNSFNFLRIIRLCRVFRVFKLSRYSEGLKTVGKAFKGTWPALSSLMLCVFMAVIFFSSFFFYAEEHRHVVSSILDGFYWTVITMTTVGYGDVVPKSIVGKLAASACMVLGILLLFILPLPVFVTHFSNMYKKHLGKKRRARNGLKSEVPTLLEKLMTR